MSAVRLQTARATSLLILSPRAGSMNPDVEAKIRKAFDGSLIVEYRLSCTQELKSWVLGFGKKIGRSIVYA